jgi:beta-glucosidase
MKGRTYRYFKGTPLYGFGFGLSYTRFAYSDLTLSSRAIRAGELLTAHVTVKNTGSVPGDEVAQLYLTPPSNSNDGLSPRLQLEGFQRIALQPGESRALHFSISPYDMSEVDAIGKRSVQSGVYKLSIGGAQPGDIRAVGSAKSATFKIDGKQEIER